MIVAAIEEAILGCTSPVYRFGEHRACILLLKKLPIALSDHRDIGKTKLVRCQADQLVHLLLVEIACVNRGFWSDH